ncbi:Uncharacterised protein [uncultured archaeon]|nr:Uncharacterised protein [uncultured archaeon]
MLIPAVAGRSNNQNYIALLFSKSELHIRLSAHNMKPPFTHVESPNFVISGRKNEL